MDQHYVHMRERERASGHVRHGEGGGGTNLEIINELMIGEAGRM